MVPDEPTATSTSRRRTSLGERRQRLPDVAAGTRRRRRGARRSPSKNRRVRRMAPSFSDRAASTSPRSPTSSSVLPPPMSHSSRRRSNTGTACSTPRWMSRASSTPGDDVDVDAGLGPRPVDEHVAVLGLAHRGGGDRGDRRVVDRGHLAEPVEGGHGPVDGLVGRARACRRRSTRAGRPPSPGRAPRCGDRPRSAVIRATTPCTELVPMSTAASVSVGGRRRAARAQSGGTRRVVSPAMATKPPKRKVKGGRVTPKGGPPRRRRAAGRRAATRRRSPVE